METEQKDIDQPQEKQQKVRMVKMVRDSEKHQEPYVAQVHPDEVNNYAVGGWVRAN